jgi:hypothetical protein
MDRKRNNNYKVVWSYCNSIHPVPEMYDKPIGLCKWWIELHEYDSQYAVGKLCLVSMMEEKTS